MKKSFLYSACVMLSFNLLSMEIKQGELHKAVLAHDFEAVKKLKESGVDVYEKDSNGKTAFDYAAKNKADKKIAAYLYPFYYDLEALEKSIGYKFQKVEKLIKAFTTREFCPERNYEIYEWFGDAILHEVLTVLLDKQSYVGAHEGVLTEARQALERKETLEELSRYLGFDAYIIKTPDSCITIDMREDVIESLIAALYKDGGAESAQNFIQRFWLPLLKNSTKAPASPVRILQKWKKETGKGYLLFRNETADLIEFQLECDENKGEVASCLKCEFKKEKNETKNSFIKRQERVVFYRAARAFIESLPTQDTIFKEMLLKSPFSKDYFPGESESNYTLDTTKWESKISLNYRYQLHMIARSKGMDKPVYTVIMSVKDHNPVFVSYVSCKFLNEHVTGKLAKTKRAAKENAAQKAYSLWKNLND